MYIFGIAMALYVSVTMACCANTTTDAPDVATADAFSNVSFYGVGL